MRAIVEDHANRCVSSDGGPHQTRETCSLPFRSVEEYPTKWYTDIGCHRPVRADDFDVDVRRIQLFRATALPPHNTLDFDELVFLLYALHRDGDFFGSFGLDLQLAFFNEVDNARCTTRQYEEPRETQSDIRFQ